MVKNGTKLSQYLTEMRQFETRMRHILFRNSMRNQQNHNLLVCFITLVDNGIRIKRVITHSRVDFWEVYLSWVT